MKLELKHLAPYLPYGLKLLVTSDDICIGTDFYNSCKKGDIIEMSISDFDRMTNGFESYLKPILRPLSDLTKEIEVNGEKFVPIIALYRLSNEYNYNNELDYEFIDSWGAGKILKVFSNREKDEYTEFIYSEGSFRKDARCSKGSYFFGMDLPHSIKYNCRMYNQDKLQQKLLEHHFDVFGLIEQGLAIDINTIKI